MNKRITFIHQYYKSKKDPGVSQIYDRTQFLASRGFDVSVISGETGYMKCEVPKTRWYKRLFKKEQIEGVTVYRTYTYSNLHKNYFNRLFGFLSFSISSSLALLFLKKPDSVIASSPPLFPIFATWLICKVRRIPFILEVRDLWPESAVQMGVIRNKTLIKIMSWMEKVLYKHAQKIIVLTEGIRDYICDLGDYEEKISLVTHGVDIQHLYPDTSNTVKLKEELGLTNKKVILYFGALGEANNINVILYAAKELSNRMDISFLLVGDGMQREKIKSTIKQLDMNNVFLHDPVSKEEARDFINLADICVVSLMDIPLFRGALPTKLFDYMACGKPILCGVKGEAEKLITESNGGYVFEPNDHIQLSSYIAKLLNNELALKNIGARNIEFIKNNYEATQKHLLVESML